MLMESRQDTQIKVQSRRVNLRFNLRQLVKRRNEDTCKQLSKAKRGESRAELNNYIVKREEKLKKEQERATLEKKQSRAVIRLERADE